MVKVYHELQNSVAREDNPILFVIRSEYIYIIY